MITKYKIAFVGLSHLGLVTSICLNSLKNGVLAIDEDKELIDKLNNKKLEIYEGGQKLIEPDLENIFLKHHETYTCSTDFSLLKNASLVFFTIDTPTDGKGSLDKLINLITKSTPFFSNNVTIVLMSQVPMGTSKHIVRQIRDSRPKLKLNFFHWVDTIVMTDAVKRFLHPERIIIGRDEDNKITPVLKDVIKLFNCETYYMSYESAEITKAFINLYLANTVTYANTLSNFCEKFNANINEVIPALRSDKRIGQYAYLKPTLSIAGGHLERDLNMLKKFSKKAKIDTKLISLIIKENSIRYKWATEKIYKNVSFGKQKPIICFWGLSYKKNSSSVKNAASIKIFNKIRNKFIIRAYDPMAVVPPKFKKIERFTDKYKLLENANCLLVLTDWDEFKKVDLKKVARLMKNKVIIDCVGVLDPKNKEFSKFKHFSIGIG